MTWARPPVSFHIIQVSMVPKRTSPFFALSLTPSTFSSSQFTLEPEKYASMVSPDLSRTMSA